MNKKSIRLDLKSFVDDEDRYRRFVRQIRTDKKGRLKFWQEQLVNDFSNSEFGYELSYSELRDTFNICEIHDIEMMTQAVKVSIRHVDVFHEDSEKAPNLHPNYLPDLINGTQDMQGKKFDIEFCPECNRLYRKWSS